MYDNKPLPPECWKTLPDVQNNNYSKMATEKFKQAFDPEKSQIQAFKEYIRFFMLISPEIMGAQNHKEAFASAFLGLPITIPTVILTSPLFLLGRAKVAIDKKIAEHDNKIIEDTLNKFYHEKSQFFKEVFVCQRAISAKLMQNKKRLIFLYELKEKNKVDKGEREFTAVVGEDENLMNLVLKIRQRVCKGNERESIHLFHNSRVITPSTKVNKLICDEMGVVKMGYVFIETFG